MLSMTLKGLQEAQRWNLRAIAALKPGGSFGRGVLMVTAALHRYSVAITHVWRYKGGGLRASHRIEFDPSRIRGRIYIDPGAINPRGQRPSKYGPAEEARGGSHAFYGRSEREEGPRVVGKVVGLIARGLQ